MAFIPRRRRAGAMSPMALSMWTCDVTGMITVRVTESRDQARGSQVRDSRSKWREEEYKYLTASLLSRLDSASAARYRCHSR